MKRRVVAYEEFLANAKGSVRPLTAPDLCARLLRTLSRKGPPFLRHIEQACDKVREGLHVLETRLRQEEASQ